MNVECKNAVSPSSLAVEVLRCVLAAFLFVSTQARAQDAPRDQVEGVLAPFFDDLSSDTVTHEPIYHLRSLEYTTERIPNSLQYQISFKAILVPKRDICNQCTTPLTDKKGRFDQTLVRLNSLWVEAQILKESRRGKLAPLSKVFQQDEEKLQQSFAVPWYEVKQSTDQQTVVYAKLLAEKTVDLWKFSKPSDIDRFNVNTGALKQDSLMVLGTAEARAFETALDNDLHAFEGSVDDFEKAIVTAATEKEEAHLDRLTDGNLAPAALEYLKQFLMSFKEPAEKRAEFFAAKDVDFYGDVKSRDEIAKILPSLSAADLKRKLFPDKAQVFALADASSCLVYLPAHNTYTDSSHYHDEIRVYFAVIRFKDGQPEGIVKIDNQALIVDSPDSQKIKVSDEELSRYGMLHFQEVALVSPTPVSQPTQTPTTEPSDQSEIALNRSTPGVSSSSATPPVNIPEPTEEQATAAFNDLQDRNHTPHVPKVWYTASNDSFNWTGPKFGKKMSMSRSQFDGEVWADYYKKLTSATNETSTRAEAEPTSSPFSGSSRTDQMNLVIMVKQAFENHDWKTLTQMTVDRMVNYFDHKHVTNAFIAQDMQNDSRNYAWVHSTADPSTFTHEVSDQYSSYWSGRMLYDSINIYTEAQERNGKLHKAMTRLTVGYVLDSAGHPAIYSLTLKVL
jgi:hypothetical protein